MATYTLNELQIHGRESTDFNEVSVQIELTRGDLHLGARVKLVNPAMKSLIMTEEQFVTIFPEGSQIMLEAYREIKLDESDEM